MTKQRTDMTRFVVMDSLTSERIEQIGDYIERTVSGLPIRKKDRTFNHSFIFQYALNDWLQSIDSGEVIPEATIKAWVDEYTIQVYVLPQSAKETNRYGIYLNQEKKAQIERLHQHLSLLGFVNPRFLNAGRDSGPSWRFLFWIMIRRMAYKVAQEA